MAWNSRDPLAFPLPASMSCYTLPPRLLTFSLQLFNQHNGESWKGVIVRQAWEKLEKKIRSAGISWSIVGAVRKTMTSSEIPLHIQIQPKKMHRSFLLKIYMAISSISSLVQWLMFLHLMFLLKICLLDYYIIYIYSSVTFSHTLRNHALSQMFHSYLLTPSPNW